MEAAGRLDLKELWAKEAPAVSSAQSDLRHGRWAADGKAWKGM